MLAFDSLAQVCALAPHAILGALYFMGFWFAAFLFDGMLLQARVCPRLYKPPPIPAACVYKPASIIAMYSAINRSPMLSQSDYIPWPFRALYYLSPYSYGLPALARVVIDSPHGSEYHGGRFYLEQWALRDRRALTF